MNSRNKTQVVDYQCFKLFDSFVVLATTIYNLRIFMKLKFYYIDDNLIKPTYLNIPFFNKLTSEYNYWWNSFSLKIIPSLKNPWDLKKVYSILNRQ